MLLFETRCDGQTGMPVGDGHPQVMGMGKDPYPLCVAGMPVGKKKPSEHRHGWALPTPTAFDCIFNCRFLTILLKLGSSDTCSIYEFSAKQ